MKLADQLLYRQVLTALGWRIDGLRDVMTTRGSGVLLLGTFVHGLLTKDEIRVHVRGFVVVVDGIAYQACVSDTGVLALAELEAGA